MDKNPVKSDGSEINVDISKVEDLSASKTQKPAKSSLTFSVRRALMEDIFLYLIVTIVIFSTSWFLMNTQNEIMGKLLAPNNSTVFVESFKEEREKLSGNNSMDVSTGKVPDRSRDHQINVNYLAYLQAQSDLNQNRYNLGAQLIVANMTRKNIGFLIGTLLSLLGCVVIVRRIRNMSVSASGNVSGQQMSLNTASPGILLALLGSIMIIATIVRGDEVRVDDIDPVSPFQYHPQKDEESHKAIETEAQRLKDEIAKSLGQAPTPTPTP
jgi:hypothetical protein